MDTQNVSAQLYFKQLLVDPDTGKFNCEVVPDGLSTCVDPVSSDAQIENAYQEQLSLSEKYKSPEIFQVMKQTFMDQTMENENTPVYRYEKPEPVPPSVPITIPSGAEDRLKRFVKESFGGNSTLAFVIILLAVLAIIYFLFLI
jgi:hypothetical protein